jgi:hypothetical protein
MDVYFSPSRKDRYIIAGMPDQETQFSLDQLYSASPLEMLPPVAYLSSPTETVFSSARSSRWQPPISGEEYSPTPLLVEFTPYSFKNLYNPTLRRTEFCAALNLSNAPGPAGVREFRRNSLGMETDWANPFIPYFVIAYDPARSRTTRNFCFSVANALASRTLRFNLIPTSLPTIVGNYNPESLSEFPVSSPSGSF